MKKLLLSLVAAATIFVLVGCGSGETKQTEKTGKSQAAATVHEKDVVKSTVPTVFIHGYGGTINSFDGMIQRLSNEGKTKREMLITVQSDGSLNVDGQLSLKKITQVYKCCLPLTKTMNGIKLIGSIVF